MKTVFGSKYSIYTVIVEEGEDGSYRAKIYRGETVVYADIRPHKTAENACKKAIDNYIKEGFAEYHKYNFLVDDFMGEGQPKKNYWKEYRAKIKADELEKIKEIASNDFCTGYYRKILD